MQTYQSRGLVQTTGRIPGLYLKPERRSSVQFTPVLLAVGTGLDQARSALERELARLYAKNDITKVEWYVERSLGIDVQGRVAWCNLDLTEQLVP